MFLALLASLVATSILRGEQLSVSTHEGVIHVTREGEPLLEYRSQPNPTKLYVSRWYSPSGIQILRDSPHDHVHHHGLMYAVGIEQTDFWAESPPEKFGRQDPVSLAIAPRASQGEGRQAVIEQVIDWRSPDDQKLAREARRLSVQAGMLKGASLLTWHTSLRPAEGRESVQLWGRHYFGLGMRFVASVDQTANFLFPGDEEGVSVRGSEQLTRARWCALQASIEGAPITVAMFDDPTNRRHPASWFTMTTPFAYLSATMRLHEQSLRITGDNPLENRYGLALWDGHRKPAEIERGYRRWLAMRPRR